MHGRIEIYENEKGGEQTKMTTKNKAFRRILILTLAFVLVFTGMGIGSWGVDEAWADEAAQSVVQVTTSDLNNKVGRYDGCTLGSADVYFLKVPSYIEKLTFAAQIKDQTVWPMVNNDDDYMTELSYVDTLYTLYRNGTNYQTAKKDYESSNITASNVQLDDSADHLLIMLYYNDDTFDFLLVEWEKENTEIIGIESLRAVIAKVPSIESTEYYHDNDRYNGGAISENGFWNDMQSALNEAKELFVDNDPKKELLETVTDKQIAVAYSKLKSSIDALIPLTEANTTVLYEALQGCPQTDESFSYNAENFATFTEKKNTAETLLSSLFTNGEATDENIPANQGEIDRVAAELRDSYSGDKMDAEIRTQDALSNFLTKASYGMKGRLLNDLTPTRYETAFSFSGELDGNGHTITVDSAYLGLVDTNNGTIRGLTVDGADLVSVSAICRINKGLIEDCHNAANFSNDANSNNKQTGALCSINDTTGIIRSCYNTGKLFGTYVGGICGENYGLIENCFNTGLITAESNAGGIAWRNCNDIMASERKLGTIRGCYNFNLMHHNIGWSMLFGSYMDNILGSIVGDNGAGSVYLGTVENSYYLDCFVKNKAYGSTITLPLSELYLTRYIKETGTLGDAGGIETIYCLGGWRVKDQSQQTFVLDQEYYLYYDKTNEHFIAVTFDENAKSNVIDAAKPSDRKETFSPSYGVYGQDRSSYDRDVYLVTVPVGSTSVKFENTEKIIDYANGYNNKYVNAYRMTDNATMYEDVPSSRLFAGTAIDADNLEAIRAAAKSICAEDAQTAALIDSMLEGVDLEKTPASSGDDSKTINVKFRLVGATKSTSGNYDVGTNCIDSQYVTWIATRTYAMKEGSSVGDLLKTAIKESGMGSQGAENNYVSGMYAPTVLGHYYLGEFTNGTRSGWMYTVNGKHPSVGLNGYILENNDSVVWHYVNDYSYEVSDWFNDPGFPNLGNASTWDPWLKVPDVDPTKDTPTIGVEDEVSNVTTDTKTGTTTAPTEVKVSEKTAADGTKEKVAEVKVSADNQKEILKQAKDSKSSEIILVVSKNDVKDATKAELTLDKSFLESIVKDTDAKLTIKTPFGDKTYTQDELKALIAAASGTTVTLTIEKSDELDEAAKLEKAKELTASLALTARSAKTAKKNVKVSLKMSKASAASIKEIQDLGYTVKYKFYRSTKKASKYAAKLTKTSKTYFNTTGAKGSKYYYKARVMVYDQDGKLVTFSMLTQCKYAARTWTK